MLERLPHGFKRWHSYDEVARSMPLLEQEWYARVAFNTQLAGIQPRELNGYCAACRQPSTFEIRGPEGVEPNWRETLECQRCGLINRWRGSVHLYRALARPDGPVYVTEQTTRLFAFLAAEQPDLIGSEYVDPTLASGSEVPWHGRSLRHEDVTRLSFATGSLAAVLSFDVLEHVPDYPAALAEFARVLAADGVLLLTVPFAFGAPATTIRARLRADGSIEHRLPPMYHGDPLSNDGVLCFQDFGWDLLDRLREVGFDAAEIVTGWTPAFGYVGDLQTFIVARRAKPRR